MGSDHVLVVEDNPHLADLYAEQLGDAIHTTVTYNGDEALEVVSERGDEIDVVLLDRRMPNRSGDEVLAEIRERGVDCAVAMVTAVDPDFDVIEMGFDDYLTKPVTEEELRNMVDRLLSRSSYDERVREQLALVSKKAALEAEKDQKQLEANEEYLELQRRIAEHRNQLDAAVSGDALVELLLKETGEHLFLVMEYDETGYEYRYIDAPVEEKIATMDGDFEELLSEFREEGQRNNRLDSTFELEGYRCSLHLFRMIMIVHFPQTSEAGVLCGFDPRTASNLTDFVSLVLPYVRDDDRSIDDADRAGRSQLRSGE